MSDYRIVKTTAIDAVTEIRFYAETSEHVKERHGEIPLELPSLTTAMDKAVANPTHMESHRPNTYVYMDTGTTNHAGYGLKVAVKVVEGTSARFSTAYFGEHEPEKAVKFRKGDADDK